jgi:hypothetical protein
VTNASANLPVPSGNATWKVIDAAQTTDMDSSGRYAKGWQVTYQLPSGHVGTVFIAGTTLNPDMVKAAISAAAANLASVVSLTSEG